jgi:hypothetical protein
MHMQLINSVRWKCDGTRAETRFRLSAKRTSPFKLARASVHSTTGSQGVRISGSNAEYTMFRGSVKSTGYPLHSPVSPSLPLQCVTVCHHISTGLYQLFMWCDFFAVICFFIITHAKIMCIFHLTLILLTWRIWWAPNNASKWQMGFNSAFKGLSFNVLIYILLFLVHVGLILSFRIWKIKFVPQWMKM